MECHVTGTIVRRGSTCFFDDRLLKLHDSTAHLSHLADKSSVPIVVSKNVHVFRRVTTRKKRKVQTDLNAQNVYWNAK
jgi:hypothetical protein